MLANLPRYWKFILSLAPLIYTAATEIYQAYNNGAADGTFSQQDLFAVIVAAATALAVLLKANTTTNPVVAQNESVVLKPTPNAF